ncbi:MAG: hypothetical protein KC503_47295 [Myxococcales bacterium]|nr:hypothetical protein [Myxococcales bacterium]
MSPEAHLTRLLEAAFDTGPAREANTLISETRGRVRSALGASFNYEVSLLEIDDASAAWSHLERVVAPRLALYLKSKRMNVASCAPVFVSLFYGDTLHFVAATDFFAEIRDASGLDEQAFAERARVWEKTGRAYAALLPG